MFRGINEFKRVIQPINKKTPFFIVTAVKTSNLTQPINNLVKDEKSDLIAGPHNILNRWEGYFS
jgi:hypothetical protein